MKQYIKTLVIPAAGDSSRFHELGARYPKCLLPYNNKPIIRHILDTLHEQFEIDDIIIVAKDDTSCEMIYTAIEQFYPRAIAIPVSKSIEESFGRGPAASVHTALRDYISAGFQRFTKNKDNVLIHLSDTIFNFDGASAPVLDQNWVTTKIYDKNTSPKRWCFLSEQGTFHDKPEIYPEGSGVVDGMYYIHDINEWVRTVDRFKKLLGNSRVKEFQISHILSQMSEFRMIHNLYQSIDLGTLEDFNRNSRKPQTKCRSFNTVEINHNPNGQSMVLKSSSDTTRLLTEASFLRSVPALDYMTLGTNRGLASYFPEVYSISPLPLREARVSYTMSLAPGVNLEHLGLFLDRKTETWDKIFNSTTGFLDACPLFGVEPNDAFFESILKKNKERKIATQNSGFYKLAKENEFNKSVLFSGLRYSFRIDDLLRGLYSELKESKSLLISNRFMHGDLHLSNMFYDFQSSSLTLIDPRGDLSGFRAYDLAKLYHSIYGYYNFIDSGLYGVNEEFKNGEPYFYDAGWENIQNSFNRKIISRYVRNETELAFVQALTASLFYSMIPLHQDNPRNQIMFFNQATTIAKQLEGFYNE